VSGPDKNRRDENSGAKLSEQSNVYLNEFFCFDQMSNKTKDLVFNSGANYDKLGILERSTEWPLFSVWKCSLCNAFPNGHKLWL
jgi:hypothetical protein